MRGRCERRDPRGIRGWRDDVRSTIRTVDNAISSPRISTRAPGSSVTASKRHGMMEGLDESFGAVIFVAITQGRFTARYLCAHRVGCRARPADQCKSVGEGGMNAILAQWFGVPVVMVTGDDVAVDEQRATVPGVRGVVVKRAINSRAVELRRSPTRAARSRSPRRKAWRSEAGHT